MLRLAVDTLRHRLTSFVGAFLALALGTTMIGLMTLALAATFGSPHSGPQRFRDARTVIAPLGFDGQPMKAPAVLPEDVIAQLPGATADRSFPVRLGATQATGHPWSSAAFAGYRLTAGRAPGSADEIVVGGGKAEQIGRHVDAYRVVGVTDARWFEDAVFFTGAEAQHLSPGVNALITDHAPPSGLKAVVLTGDDRTQLDPDPTGGTQALANAQAMAGSTTGLAVCVAVFVVIATFAFATEQRRRELALLRLVGAAPRQVRRMVLGEALLIGVAAAVAGCALAPFATGALRAWMVDHHVAPGWFTIPLNPLPLLVTFAIGVTAALVGAAATLVRVSLIRPIEVLRESAVERRGMTPVRWLLGAAMLVGAVTAGVVIARTEPYLAASARKYEAVPVLYVGAVALLAPVLLRPVTALLTAPLRRSAKAGPMLVRENILTSRRRTAATVAPIVVAVGLVGTLLTMQKSGDAASLARQRQEVHAAAVVTGADAATVERLEAVPGLRVTPATPMNIRLGTAQDEQIDSLGATAVPAAALGTTVTPPVVSGSLASPPPNFLVIDEKAAAEDGLKVGDEVVTLLPTGARVRTVVTAVIARGLNGDDAYVSASLAGGLSPSLVYLDSAVERKETAQALAGSGAQLSTYDAYLDARRAHAAEQTDTAAVVILGIALAYALIAVANTLVMALAGRRREFALLGLAGAVRGQIIRMAAAESAVAVVVGTVLAVVATGLAAATQHASLSRLVTDAPTVVPWAQLTATVALCALVTLVTASGAAGRAARQGAAVPQD
ncbi:FtsX-like permease family protein [Streptomyces sp. NRRL WC-3742]|uniref:FtsX-like permease family protein n=1 Tax=Streptomyces sp. NRRL WC-3742 TaxID=1463934 RepID=UPI00068C326E|nr:FtsX-like permease family protein [Streptomyces sp. NRRL WC-3742]